MEANYRRVKKHGEERILPLVQDLTNPSSGLGWAGTERESLADRGPVDTALALALIHHLAISNNVPLDRVADYLSRLCRTLIIEFVPKEDSQVQRLLRTREDIFTRYDEEHFRAAFGRYFDLLDEAPVAGSMRRLFLMAAKAR